MKNFEENSPKADRYLTDDESGIENFLKTLNLKNMPNWKPCKMEQRN